MDDFFSDLLFHDLATVVARAAALAWTATREVTRALAPVVRPPRALRVRADDGREFSGVLLIEGNEILFGIVVAVGQGEPARVAPAYREPYVTPPPRDDRDRPFLRSWGADPREDEDEPWRR